MAKNKHSTRISLKSRSAHHHLSVFLKQLLFQFAYGTGKEEHLLFYKELHIELRENHWWRTPSICTAMVEQLFAVFLQFR